MNYPQLWRTSGIFLSVLLSLMAAGSSSAAGHTIRSGETFTSIARKYNISVASLQKANPKVKPGVIINGRNLSLPGNPANPTAAGPKGAKPVIVTQAKAPRTAKLSKSIAALPEPSPSVVQRTARRTSGKPITTYRVRPGDTATALARRSGISVGELAEINGLERLDLHQGQKLVLPANVAPAPVVEQENTVDITPPARRAQQEELPARRTAPSSNPPATPGTYYHVVKRGETFSSIARERKVSVTALTKANKAVDPARLTVGQSINVPGIQLASRQTDDEIFDQMAPARPTFNQYEAADADLPANSESAMEDAPSIAYRITGRDTPETLAGEFNTSPADLRRDNNMGPFDQFSPGSYIRVPWKSPPRRD